MKNWLSCEFERLVSVEASSELYQIFLRLVQALSFFGIVYFLIFVMPFFLSLRGVEGMSEFSGTALIANSIVFSTAPILLAEFSIRATKRKKFAGTAIGLVLSAMMLPSIYCIVGIFGFYCFLNESFQREYLVKSPLAFRRLLVALHLNKVDSGSLR